VVKGCPRFGDWDWCNAHCDLYEFCDGVYVVQKAQTDKPITDTIKDLASKLLQAPPEEATLTE